MQLNQQLYNIGLYGTDGTIATVYPTDLAVFSGFSLADGKMIITNLTDSAAEREVNTGNLSGGDGMYVNGDYWRKKPIEIYGRVEAASLSALEAYLDTIRKNLRKRQQNLDVTRKDESGNVLSVRRYIATWMNPDELFTDRQAYHLTYCPFSIRFDCHYPFGRDRADTSESLTLTTAVTNHQVYHAGTASADAVFSMIFDAASSVSAVNIQRIDTDGTVLEEIEYTGSIAAGDILVFNGSYDSKQVTKNGSPVAYSGSFVSLEPDVNLIRFTVTSTSFNAICTIAHKSTFL